MNKSQIWTIVGISLVVAVIASIATASITGNVIKINQDRYGKYQVYTISEIDTKLNDINTNLNTLTEFVEDRVMEDIENLQQDMTPQQRQEVLDTINRGCSIYSVAVPNATRQVTGDEICRERNAGTCILMINYDRFSSNDMIQKCTPYVTGKSDETSAYCCHA